MIEKLKKYGLYKPLMIILAGLCLVIFMIPNNKNEIKESSNDKNITAEERLLELLESKYGKGRVSVMITEKELENSFLSDNAKKTVEGVVVLVDRDDIETVSLEILRIVMALFSVPAHKVVIMKM